MDVPTTTREEIEEAPGNHEERVTSWEEGIHRHHHQPLLVHRNERPLPTLIVIWDSKH